MARRLLVEQKSAGQDLDKAHSQGMEYIRGLVDSGREKEVPRWLIVSDFQRIALHDLEPEQDPDLPLLKRQPPSIVFPLSDLHKHIRRIPLKKSPHIVCANALRIDWKTVLPPEKCSYILGNPPFVGSKYMDATQREEMLYVWGKTKGAGVLDFVTAWYRLAAEYIQNTKITCAFVSTNSISQGEQPGIIWNDLYQHWSIKIHFAHRSFVWDSEARGKAHVHCVIIGFGGTSPAKKLLYDYDSGHEEPTVTEVANISPYLIAGPDLALPNRSTPICDVPAMGIGNKPIDGGFYLFTEQEKNEFLTLEPKAAKWFRKWIGSDEFINGWHRWCLWLGDCPPNELREMPMAMERVESVKKFRLASKSAPTQKLASTPTRFHVENFPTKEFLVVPEVSSERRPYIPIGYISPDTIGSNLVKIM